MKRWPLRPGDRVYLRRCRAFAVVARITESLPDVELFLLNEDGLAMVGRGPQTFMWDEAVVPVDLVVAQCLGLDLVEYKAKGVPT